MLGPSEPREPRMATLSLVECGISWGGEVLIDLRTGKSGILAHYLLQTLSAFFSGVVKSQYLVVGHEAQTDRSQLVDGRVPVQEAQD